MNRMIVLFMGALALSSCGKEDSKEIPIPTPVAENRSAKCAVKTEPEPDPAEKAAFIKQLDGYWYVDRASADSLLAKNFVGFPSGEHKVVRSNDSSKSILTDVIVAEKICVSRVLDRADELDGYRIIEFVADNEGVAVAAVKIHKTPNSDRTDGISLSMTPHKYFRYGATDPLLTENDVLIKDEMTSASPMRPVHYPIWREK